MDPQIEPWFYLCLALCGVILTMLTMFFNYSLKLDWRTAKLEKKNGHEQHQIDQLRKELERLKNSPK
ncbi:MAG: Lipopolysaccharide assembly protein A [Mycoplasmataceae bacterium]|nr:MAG: Lipopolysaccharide assembly protein A [Mycoplasmataceae bacterium]